MEGNAHLINTVLALEALTSVDLFLALLKVVVQWHACG
jgi:hypothetical protein